MKIKFAAIFADQYQPLYVVVKNEQYDNRYELADPTTYDLVMNQNQSNGNPSEHKIVATCSITDTNEPLLEITSTNEKSVDGFCCNTPIRFFIRQKKTNADYYSIGFMVRIYTECFISIVLPSYHK